MKINISLNTYEAEDNYENMLIQKEEELKDLTEKLAELKHLELKLTNDCAQIRIGPIQINSVDKILQDSMMNEVKLQGFKNTLVQNLKDDIYLRAAKSLSYEENGKSVFIFFLEEIFDLVSNCQYTLYIVVAKKKWRQSSLILLAVPLKQFRGTFDGVSCAL